MLCPDSDIAPSSNCQYWWTPSSIGRSLLLSYITRSRKRHCKHICQGHPICREHSSIDRPVIVLCPSYITFLCHSWFVLWWWGMFVPPWWMDFLFSSPDTYLGFGSEKLSYYHNHACQCHHYLHHSATQSRRWTHGGNQVVLFSAWCWMMLVTVSGMETKPFRQAILFQRELDQNSTKRYCVMCSSLFRTVQQQSSQIDTPPSHAAERVHGVVGLISSS